MNDPKPPAPAVTPALWYIKAMIELLAERDDRAMIRAWMLATFDEHGDSFGAATETIRGRLSRTLGRGAALASDVSRLTVGARARTIVTSVSVVRRGAASITRHDLASPSTSAVLAGH
jgi:hypothetical protein